MKGARSATLGDRTYQLRPGLACLALVLGCAWCAHAAPSVEDTLFIPGTVPYDTQGNKVEAHGGGMLQANNLYYWVGAGGGSEGAKYGAAIISRGINLYSSPDLATWTFEGEILSGDQIKGMPYPAPYRIERPKILWNAQTQHYVLFFHCDTGAFEYPAVGVARSQSITGPYTWVRVFKPDGEDSYDMTAYMDPDGTGYLIRSVGNVFLGISALTSDFLDTTGICSRGPRGEGPALFHAGDRTYMLMSGLTGWNPNPANLISTSASRLCGASWQQHANPASTEGGNTTFDSQSTHVLPLTLDDGSTLFVYMGDRWNFKGPGSTYNASYVWLPLLPRSGGRGFEIVNVPQWRPRDFLGRLGSSADLAPSGAPRTEDHVHSGGSANGPDEAEGIAQTLLGPFKDHNKYTNGARP